MDYKVTPIEERLRIEFKAIARAGMPEDVATYYKVIRTFHACGETLAELAKNYGGAWATTQPAEDLARLIATTAADFAAAIDSNI